MINEIYESPAGVENHWQQAQNSWSDFAATLEILGNCEVQTLHCGEITESLW